MILFEQGDIYLCVNPIDWRMLMRGLSYYALTVLNIDLDSREDECYILFFNKNRSAIRILFKKDGKKMLLEARLNKSQGKFPVATTRAHDGKDEFHLSLTRAELASIVNAGSTHLKYS